MNVYFGQIDHKVYAQNLQLYRCVSSKAACPYLLVFFMTKGSVEKGLDEHNGRISRCDSWQLLHLQNESHNGTSSQSYFYRLDDFIHV